jgi:hypothetical protein
MQKILLNHQKFAELHTSRVRQSFLGERLYSSATLPHLTFSFFVSCQTDFYNLHHPGFLISLLPTSSTNETDGDRRVGKAGSQSISFHDTL